MTQPKPPAFDPRDVAESNATSYPEVYRAANQQRYNRRLGQHAGLKNFGVNITRIVPGGQSSYRHAHSTQWAHDFIRSESRADGECHFFRSDGHAVLTRKRWPSGDTS